MGFKCQEDSFLKEFETTAKDCDFGRLVWKPPGESEPKQLEGYYVTCEDTILFPEGGGQPCDYGTMNGFPVRSVVRKGSDAVHFVETREPFVKQQVVRQCLDWERRLDHMQQHSGQHLITALFDREFNYDTTSWYLGADDSFIELNTQHLISRESLDLIERKANELIRAGREVSVLLVDPDAAKEFHDARAPRGLPKDHVGLARVVRIEDVESNMCCGTHVSNLTQLQCIKLLYAERYKGNVLVHFVVGQRVIRKLGECFQREQQLNLALKGGPTEHLILVKKLQNSLKSSTKSYQKLLREFATKEVDKIENMSLPRPKYYSLHRKDGVNFDFIDTFLRNAPEGILYFLTVSENTMSGGVQGAMVLRGDEKLLQKFAPEFLQILDGKGGGKGGQFQAKIKNIQRIPECEMMLKEYFQTIQPPTEGL